MCPNLSSNVVEWPSLSEYDATFFLRPVLSFNAVYFFRSYIYLA